MVKRQVPGLNLWSYWAEGADFKAEMDPNLAKLSVVCQGAVKSRTTTLPGSGLAGDIYLVPNGAGSNPNQIAYWDGASGAEAWAYLVPKEGWRFWVSDEDKLYVYSGTAWVEFEQGSGGGGVVASETGYVARQHRFWGLVGMESDATEISAVQIEMRSLVGGSELVANPSASSVDGANAAANAYDDDAGTFWRSSGDNGNAIFSFDAGTVGGDPANPIRVSVAELSVTARGGGAEAEAPARMWLAYSDDGTNWVPLAYINAGTFTTGQTKTFDVSNYTTVIEIVGDDLRVDSLVAIGSGAFTSTGLDLAGKDGVRLYLDQIDVDTDGTSLDLTLYIGGVEITTGYQWGRTLRDLGTGTLTEGHSASGAAIPIATVDAGLGLEATGSNLSAVVDITNVKNGEWKSVEMTYSYTSAGGAIVIGQTQGVLRNAGALTGWKLTPSTGTVESGTCRQQLVEAEAFGAMSEQAGSASSLLDLSDTPGTYGAAGQVLKVNSGATGVEWADDNGGAALEPIQSIIVAASDETTDLTTGTAKITFRMPYAFTLTGVRASVTTAPVGSALTVDINEGGVSILSTLLTIDDGEKTSTTAATAAAISDTALADDAEITIDIDAVGSGTAGAGLKVTLIGRKAA